MMVAALSHVSCWLHRVQNRYLWKRYMHEKKLVSMATGEGGVNEKWLWHGTSRVDPFDICRHMDGVDFRMVGGPCRSAVSPVRVSDAMGGCVSTSLSCLLVCVCACVRAWLYGCACGILPGVAVSPTGDSMAEAHTLRSERRTHTPATATREGEEGTSSFLRGSFVARARRWGRPPTGRW